MSKQSPRFTKTGRARTFSDRHDYLKPQFWADPANQFWVAQGGKPHMPEDLWFYESSWDMLMPVVEKISELECVYSIDYHVHMVTIFSDETFQKHGEGISIVYQVVIDFLKWYNTQTPKS